MNPYSGLIELFEKQDLLVKQGNRLKYVDLNGQEHLEYRKAWMTPEKMDLIMSEYEQKIAPAVNTEDDVVDETTEAELIEE
jgi:hypothetical protein